MPSKISEKISFLKKSTPSKETDKKRGKSEWGSMQPPLPLFKKLRNVSSFLSILIFVLALGGCLFFATVDASLTNGSDATLPPRVREVRREYTDIKDKYARFDFDMFRKITGKIPLRADPEEDKMWGEASKIFFGISYLDDLRASLNNVKEPEDAANVRVQAPALQVTGWMMTTPDDCVVMLTNDGTPAEWAFHRKGKKWSSDDIPSEFDLSEMQLSPKSGAPYFTLNYKTHPHLKWKVMLTNGFLEEGPRTAEETANSGLPYIKLENEEYIYMTAPIANNTQDTSSMTPTQRRRLERLEREQQERNAQLLEMQQEQSQRAKTPLPTNDEILKLGLPDSVVGAGVVSPQNPIPQQPNSVQSYGIEQPQPQVPGMLPR